MGRVYETRERAYHQLNESLQSDLVQAAMHSNGVFQPTFGDMSLFGMNGGGGIAVRVIFQASAL